VPLCFASIGVNDHPVPAGTRSQLLKREAMDALSIAERCRQIMKSEKNTSGSNQSSDISW
jgi:hypothetical protein